MGKQAQKLPKGTFYTIRNGRFCKWRIYNNGKFEEIKKTDINLARSAAFATFLRLCIKDATVEAAAIKAYLRNTEDSESNKNIENPEIRKLLSLSPLVSDKVAEWAVADYPKSTRSYKGVLYKTLKGDLVKSISERDIADELFTAGIPYRYECVISFDNGAKTYCPDFIIMDPRTGKIYIWEHFGITDLNHYLKENADKMYTYFENGYIPGKNLICTSNYENAPLTKGHIKKVIDFYFN